MNSNPCSLGKIGHHSTGNICSYEHMNKKLFTIAVFSLWFILLGMLLGRSFFVKKIDRQEMAALEKARHERYYGVWFQQRRIGYVAETLAPDGDTVMLHQQAHILHLKFEPKHGHLHTLSLRRFGSTPYLHMDRS